MIQKTLEQITEEDLQHLIENEKIEDKTIEYKESLSVETPSEKKEFLADVSSFANTIGGDLIYGIEEDRDTGIPKSLKGLEIDNLDNFISRLNNIILDGIQPRISSLGFQRIKLKNLRYALVIRIGRSWNMPHRVIYDKHDKFYARKANGKFPLDVSDLRNAFNLSETLTERIRRFREDRLSNISTGNTPILMQNGAKIILHLIPLISFNSGQCYDLQRLFSSPKQQIECICGYSSYERLNLDGLLIYNETEEEANDYVQIYKNGIIEGVDGSLLDNGKAIPSVLYEGRLIAALTGYLSILKKLGVELPIFVFLTLIGVKDYIMGLDRYRYRVTKSHSIDRDTLLIPELIIDNYNVKSEIVLKPLFDSIWNACGLWKSDNYNKEGQWVSNK